MKAQIIFPHSETRAENIFPLIIVSFSGINVYFLLTTTKAIKKLFPAKRFQHMGITSLALQMCYNKQIKEHLFEWPVISPAAVRGSCEQFYNHKTLSLDNWLHRIQFNHNHYNVNIFLKIRWWVRITVINLSTMKHIMMITNAIRATNAKLKCRKRNKAKASEIIWEPDPPGVSQGKRAEISNIVAWFCLPNRTILKQKNQSYISNYFIYKTLLCSHLKIGEVFWKSFYF